MQTNKNKPIAMKVFVTGATGYVGRYVVAELIEQGHSVVGLCRSKESADILRKAGGVPLLGMCVIVMYGECELCLDERE